MQKSENQLELVTSYTFLLPLKVFLLLFILQSLLVFSPKFVVICRRLLGACSSTPEMETPILILYKHFSVICQNHIAIHTNLWSLWFKWLPWGLGSLQLCVYATLIVYVMHIVLQAHSYFDTVIIKPMGDCSTQNLRPCFTFVPCYHLYQKHSPEDPDCWGLILLSSNYREIFSIIFQVIYCNT